MNRRHSALILPVVALMLIGCSIPTTEADSASPTPQLTPIAMRTALPDRPGIGEEGRIRVDGDDSIVVATSRPALDELRKALAAADRVGYMELARAGRIILIANGTHVLHIESDGFFTQAWRLRVLEGPHKDRAIWTEPDWVVK